TTSSTQNTDSTRVLHGLAGYELADIVRQSNVAEDVTWQILETLLSEGRLRRVGVFWFAQHIWDMLADEAVRLVREYHRLYPLRSGFSKEEWRVRLNLSPRMANEVFAVLQTEGRLVASGVERGEGRSRSGHVLEGSSSRAGGLLRLPDFAPRFTSVQQQQVTRLLRRFQESP